MEVEFTGTRDVHVAGRLVGAGIQIERDHVCTDVVRGVDPLISKGVRDVVAEELRGDVTVQIDTVSLEQDAVNSGQLALVAGLAIDGGNCSAELSTGGGRSRSTRESRGRRSTQGNGGEAVEHERVVELCDRKHGTTDNTSIAKSGKSSHEVEADTGEGVEVGEVLGSGDTSRHG